MNLLSNENIQHGLSRGTSGLTVIAVPLQFMILSNDIGIAVMRGIPVLLLHCLDELKRLFFRMDRYHSSDKAGFLLNDLALAAFVYRLIL